MVRKCNNPPPSKTGQPCLGIDVKTDRCNPTQCPEWQKWGEFSSCSKECGHGVQKRTRLCKIYSEGQNCIGDNEETKSCEGLKCAKGNTTVITILGDTIGITKRKNGSIHFLMVNIRNFLRLNLIQFPLLY